MKLQSKLLTVFGGLALMVLLVAGVTMWMIFQWKTSNENLQNHYQRSLLLQRVRATAFRASIEVSDATSGDERAPHHFEELIKPAEQDFKRWAELADTVEERTEVQQVRAAFDQLKQDARSIFNLVDAGRREEAFELTEQQFEDVAVAQFQELTEQAVVSDQNKRAVIRASDENIRRTAKVVLLVAAFGTLSLTLLLAAYLASDLFAPLRNVRQALDDVAHGDLKQRLDAERGDELGEINRGFNAMVEAIAHRERVAAMSIFPNSDPFVEASDSKINGLAWRDAPSRLTLHMLISQLRSRVSQIGKHNGTKLDAATTTGTDIIEHEQELVDQLDHLLHAVTRITEFGFPLDLNLASTDVRALLYEVVLRFHGEFVDRAISFEVEVAPEVSHAVVDRLKLREALSELVRNGLAALPAQGGRLSLRAAADVGQGELLIEVADNGRGTEQSALDKAFEPVKREQDDRFNVGLTLTKAIVEQHGGRVEIKSEIGRGTHAKIRLPLRDYR